MAFGDQRVPLKRSPMKRRRTPPSFTLAAKGDPFCRVCGEMAEHAHHSVPRSMAPAGRNDLRNCLPLCGAHHRRWHDGEPISRSVFTPTEWQFVSSLVGESWLNRRYPLDDSTQTSPEVTWPLTHYAERER